MLLKGESQLPDLQGPRSYMQRLMFRRECVGLGKVSSEIVLAAINQRKQLRTDAHAHHEGNTQHAVHIDPHKSGDKTCPHGIKDSVNRADFSNLKREDDSEYRSALRRKKSSASLTIGACYPKKAGVGSHENSEKSQAKQPCWKACYVSTFCTARDFDRLFRDRLFREVTGLNDDPSERKLFNDCRGWSLYDAVAEANELSIPFVSSACKEGDDKLKQKSPATSATSELPQQLGAHRQPSPDQSTSRIDLHVKASRSRLSDSDGAEPVERPRLRRSHSTSADVAQQLYAPFKDTVLDFEVRFSFYYNAGSSCITFVFAAYSPSPAATAHVTSLPNAHPQVPFAHFSIILNPFVLSAPFTSFPALSPSTSLLA
jgi:hypothetical protein